MTELSMRATSLSRPFLILLAVAFSLVVIVAVRLTYVFGAFSEQGAKLTRNIRATSLLNQKLRDEVLEQVRLVREQLDSLSPSFPDKFTAADDSISKLQIEYLKLDIGEQERMAVEKMSFLHSELGVEGFHVFEFVRSGRRADAKIQLARIEQLEEQIQGTFEELYDLQMQKLQAVQDQLNRSVSAAFLTISGLAASLLFTLGIFIALLRRRVLSPLISIHRAANKVTEGDFSARASVGQLDEIGDVARAFNFMAESLAQSYADLERRVEERTRQVRELQQEVVQAAKMSAVGQMISGVAHELNNPLTVIMGYTELSTARLCANGGDPEQIKLAEELHFQADRCRKIVANLLQFARKVHPECEPIWINELIEKIIQLREYEFQTRNVSVLREYDPANPEVCADKNKLQQVLINLTSNAYDAIREADRPGHIWVRTKSANDSVIIEISDDGTGICEPDRVFEPFYTTKEVGKGTGLGLSVCYSVIKEHSGQIIAQNWERGARFTVTLPVGRHEESIQTPTPNEQHAVSRKRYRALVVDDELPIVKLQSSFLSSIGIEASGVNSGEAAISFLKDSEVDIVISDIRMPGPVDGLGLYKWIEQNREALASRFVFVTGDSIGLRTEELLQDRAIPHLEKPFSLKEYSRVVRAILEDDRKGV